MVCVRVHVRVLCVRVLCVVCVCVRCEKVSQAIVTNKTNKYTNKTPEHTHTHTTTNLVAEDTMAAAVGAHLTL